MVNPPFYKLMYPLTAHSSCRLGLEVHYFTIAPFYSEAKNFAKSILCPQKFRDASGYVPKHVL
jgi:hypothetical protein